MRTYTWTQLLLLLLLLLLCASARARAPSREHLDVWQDFVAKVKSGRLSVADVRPHRGLAKEPLVRFANEILTDAPARRLSRPEVVAIGQRRVLFIIELGSRAKPSQFCFSFVRHHGRWLYQHVENIFIRLDRIGRLPTSSFPALPKERLSWMREENRISRDVNLYNALRKKMGKAAALGYFIDGSGYTITAKTWVPFVSPRRAFVLYACWEQTHLRGGKATLLSLSDARAQVKLEAHRFELYRRTGHLRRLISLADYRELFETIWRDRARHAGWKVRFSYGRDGSCLLTFRRAAT